MTERLHDQQPGDRFTIVDLGDGVTTTSADSKLIAASGPIVESCPSTAADSGEGVADGTFVYLGGGEVLFVSSDNRFWTIYDGEA